MIKQMPATEIAAPARIFILIGDVRDMAEQMAARVLRPGAAHIGAEAPIHGRDLFEAETLDREVAQQDETAPVHDLVLKILQGLPECGHGEVYLGHIGDVVVTAARLAHGIDHFVALGLGKRMDPRAGFLHFRAVPDAWPPDGSVPR